MFFEIEVQSGDYTISTDRSRLDVEMIYSFLTESYWAKGIPKHLVEKSIDNSLCFGLYALGKQVGFARVISDFTTFAWLGDVFILEENRGRGLGRWLVTVVMEHPDLYNLRRWILVTKDAQEFYKKYEFQQLAHPEHLMEVHNPKVYEE